MAPSIVLVENSNPRRMHNNLRSSGFQHSKIMSAQHPVTAPFKVAVGSGIWIASKTPMAMWSVTSTSKSATTISLSAFHPPPKRISRLGMSSGLNIPSAPVLQLRPMRGCCSTPRCAVTMPPASPGATRRPNIRTHRRTSYAVQPVVANLLPRFGRIGVCIRSRPRSPIPWLEPGRQPGCMNLTRLCLIHRWMPTD